MERCEEGWEFEDDIPLEKSTARLVPSRRTWTKNQTHELATKWNTEMSASEQRADRAVAEGG